jgi:predicted XRE-type DNA-binding protein
MTKRTTERIRPSSGNVFKDLGFPPEEAAHLLIRSDLMVHVERILKERGLTQANAAKLLGISQPRVSDLVRGRVDRFSIDTLVDMLARLGVSVTIRTRRSHRVA